LLAGARRKKQEGEKQMLNNINLDLSSVTTDSNQLIPDGIYSAKVIQAEQKTSNSGNPMIAVTLAVSNNQGITGNIKEFMVLNSTYALKRLKELLIASKFPNPDSISNTEQLIGLEMQVVIIQKMERYGLKSRIVQFLTKSETASPKRGGSNTFDS
jgi:hypothetical protein